MEEIRCPKCGEVFQVDKNGYDQIARQVRDKEFLKELDSRLESDLKVIRLQKDKELSESITQKDIEILQKNQTIAELQAKLDASETEKNLAISKALEKKNEELTKEEKTYSEHLSQKELEISDRDKLISELKAKLNASETEKKLAVAEAVEQKNAELSQKVTEIANLRGEIKSKETENRLKEQSLQKQYENKLKQKEELIEYYKDLKVHAALEVGLNPIVCVGESLEQHCLTQFNSIRMTAFPNAYFEKDNDAKTGSKGDFIYRESSEEGTEFISIMFEMKNEADTTATKHKNEDFFKELDKDRREKGCEYAILVSLLEIDNELYNNGIVDVSYKFPKMYVIRPQFFIPMITLLRNAAQNSLHYRHELQIVRNQQIDISHFEENMNDFKEGFAHNYRLASEKFVTAIEEIDKTIDHLQKTKKALLSSENNLRLANKKADDLSIKKLTKNAPSLKVMFDDLKHDE